MKFDKDRAKRQREINNNFDPLARILEKEHAARITPELTYEEINNASASRAALYKETDSWLSKYKFDESRLRNTLDVKLEDRSKARELIKGHVFLKGLLTPSNDSLIDHCSYKAPRPGVFKRLFNWLFQGTSQTDAPKSLAENLGLPDLHTEELLKRMR